MNFIIAVHTVWLYHLDSYKILEKKLMMLCAALNKFWKQLPTKQQLYSYLSPILQTIHEMLSTAVEARTNSSATFSYGLLHMDTLVLTDQQKLTYIGSVSTLDTI